MWKQNVMFERARLGFKRPFLSNSLHISNPISLKTAVFKSKMSRSQKSSKNVTYYLNDPLNKMAGKAIEFKCLDAKLVKLFYEKLGVLKPIELTVKNYLLF